MDLVRQRVAGLDVTLRRAGERPILYVHGVPNDSGMWEPFLERTGGVAVDLPGFGVSDKPNDFDYSIAGYGRFLGELMADSERFSLVMHDWGAVGLALALARPEAIEKIVLVNAVPFLPGYRWHRVARVWRTPVAGELFQGFATKWGFKLLARREGTLPRDVVDAEVDRVWEHFDHGTQRAILRLYRSAPEDVLAKAGEGLGALAAPGRSLVVWGKNDPYIPLRFASDYAGALGGASHVVDAGHWPWLEDPSVIDRVESFLAG